VFESPYPKKSDNLDIFGNRKSSVRGGETRFYRRFTYAGVMIMMGERIL
jgi:hypothetical protein